MARLNRNIYKYIYIYIYIYIYCERTNILRNSLEIEVKDKEINDLTMI